VEVPLLIPPPRPRARREGKRLGRPRALLPVEVEKLRALIAGGMSQRKAAEAMGVKESTARLLVSAPLLALSR
jgi:hypothetical protein